MSDVPFSALPPRSQQIVLRTLAALAHVWFVAGVMRDSGAAPAEAGDLPVVERWLAWAVAGGGDLWFFVSGLADLAPWAVAEGLTLALVFGVPFSFLVRVAAAAALSVFAVKALGYYRMDPTRVTQLLFVITECLTVVLVLAARPATRADWSPVTAFFTVAATFYFLALEFAPPFWRLIPEWAGVLLQVTGVSWGIFAKLSLGRSFGLLPADRGIVTRGAYRVVRHPIYLGYFVSHAGYLLANCNGWNVLVFTGLHSFQVVRLVREERLLRENPEYRDYCHEVPWRLLPGFF